VKHIRKLHAENLHSDITEDPLKKDITEEQMRQVNSEAYI
jgi:hypothetical protein